MLTLEQTFKRIGDGEPVVNIGQLDTQTERALDRMVRRGWLVKWRGHWFPLVGHPTYGMGPLKTCYALENPYANYAGAPLVSPPVNPHRPPKSPASADATRAGNE